MAHPLHALYTARELQQRQRDAAQQALQQAERRLAHTLAQGQTLSHYRADTQQRYGLLEGRPLGAEQVATVQGFTRRLDEALDQFSSVSMQAREQAEQCRTRLTAAQMRLSVLDKLIERREASLHRRAERLQQRDDDERASAQARRPTHTDDTPQTEESTPWPL
jgi:flagellar FliJ protein